MDYFELRGHDKETSNKLIKLCNECNISHEAMSDLIGRIMLPVNAIKSSMAIKEINRKLGRN